MPAAAAPTGWSRGYNFRATEGYGAPDQDDEVWADEFMVYPFTFDSGGPLESVAGWPIAGYSAWDRNNTTDRRLSGAVYFSGLMSFEVDVPGPGTYRVVVAAGDSGSSGVNWNYALQFADQATVRATTSQFNVTAGNMAGATGVVVPLAQWITDANAVSVYQDVLVDSAGGAEQVIVSTTNNVSFTGLSHIRVIEL